MTQPPSPNWRIPVGMLAMLVYVAVWCILIVSVSETLAEMSLWIRLGIYIIAGMAWIMPLKPFLAWMQTGKWRE
ncbi:MAG: DUF2842 domain-containing protein [Parasphingorhabdus sp.]|nr:DUF2842 domain-containing protein [Parasphingorhabdus sp.]